MFFSLQRNITATVWRRSVTACKINITRISTFIILMYLFGQTQKVNHLKNVDKKIFKQNNNKDTLNCNVHFTAP